MCEGNLNLNLKVHENLFECMLANARVCTYVWNQHVHVYVLRRARALKVWNTTVRIYPLDTCTCLSLSSRLEIFNEFHK